MEDPERDSTATDELNRLTTPASSPPAVNVWAAFYRVLFVGSKTFFAKAWDSRCRRKSVRLPLCPRLAGHFEERIDVDQPTTGHARGGAQ